MDSPHCLPAQLKEIWKKGTDFESRMEDAIRSVEVQDDIERTIEVLCTACCEALYNAVEHSEFCEDGPASVVLKHSNTGIGAVYAQAHSGFDTMSLPEGEVLPETSRESCGGSGGYRLNVPEISVNYIHEESRFLTLILLQFD